MTKPKGQRVVPAQVRMDVKYGKKQTPVVLIIESPEPLTTDQQDWIKTLFEGGTRYEE